MSTIKANTLLHSDGTSTTAPSIPALDTRFATAWILFDGVQVNVTGNAIQNSYNFSSITDVAAGRHYINFTNNMTTNNYVTVTSGLSTRNGTNREASAAPFDATKCYVNTRIDSSGGSADIAVVSLVVFGG